MNIGSMGRTLELKPGPAQVDMSAVAVTTRAATIESIVEPGVARRGYREKVPGAALLVLAAVLFLGYGAPTIAAPFGDSHDGRNASVWAAGSRSVREDGPVASRLGARNPAMGLYANHPPLIYLETAVAEGVGLSSSAATRAPAWLGSLAFLVLVGLLLRDRGLAQGASSFAALLVATTPIFLVYGTMLDTPVTSLPFGVGLLVLWERARAGKAVRPLYACALTALAVLAGWQAMLLAFFLAVWALLRLVRRTGRRDLDAAFVVGALVGAGLLLGWLLWAFGGTLSPLLDQFRFRSGQSTQRVGLPDLLWAQGSYAVVLIGVVGVIAVPGLILALFDRRLRGLAAVALGVTVSYTLLFRAGAVNHDYWGYWFLLPIAIGLGAGSDRLLMYWRSRGRAQAGLAFGVCLLAVLLTVVVSALPPAAESHKLEGLHVADVVAGVTLDSGQEVAWYAGAVGEPASWLAHATGRLAVKVGESEYGAVAEAHPTALVLVGEVRCVAGADHRWYEFRPAASLVERPPAVVLCSPEPVSQPDGPPRR